MLNILNLTKKYGKTLACDNVSIHLDKGCITVLLGPNGAGKSTLIKSVIGFLRYTGEISICGLPNKTVESKKILGYIPEIPSLYPNLTVAEHMEFIARAYKLENYKDYIEELFERFELTDKKKKFGDELSKGMQQKLNICLGLLPRPRMILFDEPMIGLDPHAIKELKKIMLELREQGCTILVSTHMIDSIDMLWDRAIIMQKGKICANVTKDELDAKNKALEEIFFAITEDDNKSEKSRLENTAGSGTEYDGYGGHDYESKEPAGENITQVKENQGDVQEDKTDRNFKNGEQEK